MQFDPSWKLNRRYWSQQAIYRPPADELLSELSHLATGIREERPLASLFPEDDQQKAFRHVVQSQLLDVKMRLVPKLLDVVAGMPSIVSDIDYYDVDIVQDCPSRCNTPSVGGARYTHDVAHIACHNRC